MGASLIHGVDLARQPFRLIDGREGAELVPIDGEYWFPSYSSVEAMLVPATNGPAVGSTACWIASRSV